MRSSFFVFLTATIVAAGFFAASAFNQAELEPRSVIATIVTDNNGYLSVATEDADYACYVDYDGGGRIAINWDGGTSCNYAGGAEGSGINAGSTYYFHDVLVITNKGTKTLTHLWLNMTDAAITINIDADPATMNYGGTYEAAKLITAVAPGDTWYIGFKIDASSTSSGSTISKELTIEARSSD